LICNEPGTTGVMKCCRDNGSPYAKTRDCCSPDATCVKPTGSTTGTCCIALGDDCIDGDGCCVGLACKKPGLGVDPSILTCCYDNGSVGCTATNECCSLDDTCVKLTGAATGTCRCIEEGEDCLGGDGCCDSLTCTDDTCQVPTPSCIDANGSCLSGGVDCCAELFCAINVVTPYEKNCQSCIGANAVCRPFAGYAPCCEGRFCLVQGSQYRCSDCLPEGDMTCQLDDDCCDPHICRTMGYNMHVCGDCLTEGNTSCQVDGDCCDPHICKDLGYGMHRCGGDCLPAGSTKCQVDEDCCDPYVCRDMRFGGMFPMFMCSYP
jgi:hypothetical protein